MKNCFKNLMKNLATSVRVPNAGPLLYPKQTLSHPPNNYNADASYETHLEIPVCITTKQDTEEVLFYKKWYPTENRNNNKLIKHISKPQSN